MASGTAAGAGARGSVLRRPPKRRPWPPAPRHHPAAAAAPGSSGRATSCPTPAGRPAADHGHRRGQPPARDAPVPAHVPRRGPGPLDRPHRSSSDAESSPPLADPSTSSIRGGTTAVRARRRARTTSTAASSVSTPQTSTPSTSLASSTAAAATTTRRSPRRAKAATIGRTPGTDRTSPPSDSSPISASRPPPARTCSEPSRIPTAIARSSDEPALRRSAGARLTVIRRGGWTKPAFRRAPRTRSRASWSAASASPTMVKPGSPGATSTSTRIIRPSRPLRVADGTMASTTRGYRRTLTARSIAAYLPRTKPGRRRPRPFSARPNSPLPSQEQRPSACPPTGRTPAATRRGPNRPS